MTPLHLPHLPPTLPIHLILYTHLLNAPHLHTLLHTASLPYALIDASTLLTPAHLLSAIFRAVTAYLSNRLKTRNVHSEIVFGLGTNNNVAQTLRAFGMSALTTELVVVRVGGEGKGEGELEGVVEGRVVEWGEGCLEGIADVGKIRQLYKLPLGGEQGGKAKRRRNDGSEGGEEVERVERGPEWEKKELEVVILGMMALRGAV